MTTSNKTLGEQVASMEVDSKVKESEAIPLLHERDRLRTQMESLQTHSNWLQAELEAKTQAYQRLQQESHDRQLQLQLQLQQTENDKESFAVREEELRKIERRLQTQVEQLSRDMMLAKQELASVKETTAMELQEEQKLANLQKEHIVRWEQRYNNVVRENEAMKSAAAEAQALLDQQLEDARNEVEMKYKKALEDQSARNRLGQGETSLVPADAGLTASEEDDDAPMGLTEVYERLEQAKSQLRAEKLRADRAELMNQRIVKEIEEKTPIMNRQREEYELAMDQMQDYQRRLELALDEKEEARADSSEARRAANNWKHQYDEKVKESKILANQVQTLLVQSAECSVVPMLSVSTMQSQNQRVLVENQQLKEKLAVAERRLDEDNLAEQLKIAKADLEEMDEQRKLQEEAVQKIVQQRDLYRSLCNVSGAMSSSQELTVQEFSKEQVARVKDLEAKLSEADGQIASLRGAQTKILMEKETTEERLARYETSNKDLTESVNRLEGEIRVARGDLARGQIEAKYHSEKCTRLEETVQRLRDEVSHVTNAKNELSRINAELQHSLTMAKNLASQKESEKLQAETQLRLAETKAETSKLAEKHALDEATQLRAEVARQGSLIDSIRRIETSLTAKSEGEVESLKEEVERLSKTLSEDRKRYDATTKNLTERASEAEARFHEATKAKEKLEAEMAKSKKELDEAVAAKGTVGGDVASQEQIDSLTTALATAKAEISSLKESAETYKKVAKGSESSMAEVSKAAESAKMTQSKELKKLQEQLEAVRKDNSSKQEVIVEITRDLAGQREEREKAVAELNSEITSLKSDLEVRNKDLESSEASLSAIKMDMQSLHSEVVNVQTNYERELKLHAEARAKIRESTEKADQEASERQKAVTELATITESVSKERQNWDEERKTLLESSKTLESALKDARAQNDLLHSQIETLGEQIKKSRSDKASSIGEGQGNVSDKQLQEMREVVKFLRSENQLIQSQLDTASRGLEREKAAAAVLKHSLDEARGELTALKDTTNMTAPSGSELSSVKEQLKASSDQVTLLSDSNKLLRDENSQIRESLKAAESEVGSLQKQLEPSDKLKLDYEAKLAALSAEKDSLRRELDSWKGRVESLVKKFNQVDPEEHRIALATVDELKKEKETADALKKNAESQNARLRDIARGLKQKQSELQGQVDAKTKEVEKLTAEKASLKGSSDKENALNEKIKSLTTQLSGANGRNETFREKLREFQKKIRELTVKEKTLMEELEKARKQQVSTPSVPAPAPAPVTKAKPTSPVPPAAAEKASEKPVEKKDEAAVAGAGESEVPSVPEGGFKFGPSTTEDDSNKELRADAPSFVPGKKAADASLPAKTPSPEAKVPSKTPEPKPRPPTRQGSGEKMEMSVKEKLMAKKRKLAELKEKKLAEAAKKSEEKEIAKDPEEPKTKPVSVPGPATKKAKKTVEEIAKEPEEPKTKPASVPGPATKKAKKAVEEPPVSEAAKEYPKSEAQDEAKEATNDAEMPDGDAEKTGSATEDVSAQDDQKKEEPAAAATTPSFKNPFASNTLGGPAPVFGQAASAVPSSSGGFLNMKPPGSTTAPPTFSFGKNSGSISLPIPSQSAPAPSPFGAFGGAFGGSPATFGSFGGSDAQPKAPQFGSPLFGAPASTDEKEDEEKEEGEEME